MHGAQQGLLGFPQVLQLDVAMLEALGVVRRVVTSEPLKAGNVVNIYNVGGSGGVVRVRQANATARGKEASGFVLSDYATGASALVYRAGLNGKLSGLIPGIEYFLSTTGGAVTDSPSTASGNVIQSVGKAHSTTQLDFLFGVSVGKA